MTKNPTYLSKGYAILVPRPLKILPEVEVTIGVKEEVEVILRGIYIILRSIPIRTITISPLIPPQGGRRHILTHIIIIIHIIIIPPQSLPTIDIHLLERHTALNIGETVMTNLHMYTHLTLMAARVFTRTDTPESEAQTQERLQRGEENTEEKSEKEYNRSRCFQFKLANTQPGRAICAG